MTLLWSGDAFDEAMNKSKWYIKIALSNSYALIELQLIEREDTGMLLTRMSMRHDGRPFCSTPGEMGTDKYGF
jgi:hypothetical protein